jgi:hypothetical protein
VRKAILVLMLVAASFLGGAAVNGPGLQWVETRVLRSLGLANGGEIALVDLKSAVGPETSVDESRLAKQGTGSSEAPHAPIPSLLTEHESSQHDNSNRPLTLQARPKSHSVGSDLSGSRIPSTSQSSIKDPIALTKALERQDSPADPDVKQASATSHLVDSGDAVRPSPNAKPDIFDTLAALLPSNSDSSATQLPSSSSLPAASTQTPLISGSDHWVIVERKMQSLGVSRYTIEGEPGTRVVFSCLIPLAGRQAIAQRFEAEGDDMVQAALAALRRITLWQAIQPTSR